MGDTRLEWDYRNGGTRMGGCIGKRKIVETKCDKGFTDKNVNYI